MFLHHRFFLNYENLNDENHDVGKYYFIFTLAILFQTPTKKLNLSSL